MKYVVGLDEVGRGALCASVVAAAVFVKNKCSLKSLKDSKQLSSKKREEIYELLKQDPNIEWGIGRVSEKVIDRINILEATKLAMKRAVRNLERKLKKIEKKQKKFKNKSMQKKCDRINFAQMDYLIIDGNFSINLNIPQKSIIKADEKVFSCAAASIVAKLTRDRMMLRYHKKYPKYGFAQHKGYPTKLHRNAIKKYGFCSLHRKTFRVS